MSSCICLSLPSIVNLIPLTVMSLPFTSQYFFIEFHTIIVSMWCFHCNIFYVNILMSFLLCILESPLLHYIHTSTKISYLLLCPSILRKDIPGLYFLWVSCECLKEMAPQAFFIRQTLLCISWWLSYITNTVYG